MEIKVLGVEKTEEQIPPEIIGKIPEARNKVFGLTVRLDADEVLSLESVYIENVFIGLRKMGEGRLEIGTLTIDSFGGDSINIFGGNVFIDNLVITNSTPTRPYDSICTRSPEKYTVEEALSQSNQYVYDPSWLKWECLVDINNEKRCEDIEDPIYIIPGYHVDAGLQAYGHIKDVHWSQQSITLPMMYEMAETASKELGIKQKENWCKSFLPVINSITSSPYDIITNDEGSIVAFNFRSLKDNLQIFSQDKQNSFNLPLEISNAADYGELVQDITIKNVDINIGDANPFTQIFMLSEEHDHCNINIGTSSLNVTYSYEYGWFVANTLRNSLIGNENPNGMNFYEAASIENKKTPLIRIGDGKGANETKYSDYSTKNVYVIGEMLQNNVVHQVPSSVDVTSSNEVAIEKLAKLKC